MIAVGAKQHGRRALAARRITRLEETGLCVAQAVRHRAAVVRRVAEQLGVNGYLVKPYREEELLAELGRAAKERTYA